MSGYWVLRLILGVVLLAGGGCEPVQSVAPGRGAASAIEGLTLADLQADQAVPEEALLSFSVLTYVLEADQLDLLAGVFDSLSPQGFRYGHAEAFEANGFFAGVGSHAEGAALAQQLHSIGAVRITQGALMIPADSHEILFGETIAARQAIIYSTSAGGVGGATIGPGKAGWILSAQPDGKEAVQMTLCPAFWEVGASDLRLLTGQDPYEFHFFDVGRVTVPLEAGQVFLLGPQQMTQDLDTLNQLLFGDRLRDRVRFFVILFGGSRSVEGD